MSIPNVMQTGRSALFAAKAGIATTGHNIANANTEGYSRQRTIQEAMTLDSRPGTKPIYGQGTRVSRIDRIHDNYLEKQIRTTNSEYEHFHEKDVGLTQLEDVFNELGGDGLNGLISGFFNNFRKLANDPNSEAVRQSVRESAHAMVNDFKRIYHEVESLSNHFDSRIEGVVLELNAGLTEVRDLNLKIRQLELTNASPNDLCDQRDKILKKIAEIVNISTYQDNVGSFIVDLPGIGPVVSGGIAESLQANRSPENNEGKRENWLSITTTASPSPDITSVIKGGKLGALVEMRDQIISNVLDRMDQMAYAIGTRVNEIHEMGYTRDGETGVSFFQGVDELKGAAQALHLSDEIRKNVSSIATALDLNAPGDNRIALAISRIQSERIMDGGSATVDDFYNAVVSDVGVKTSHAKSSVLQQQNILTQMNKLREQISGVSIDEETTNLLQFQHSFDAAAKVIQVADQMLSTILELKR